MRLKMWPDWMESDPAGGVLSRAQRRLLQARIAPSDNEIPIPLPIAAVIGSASDAAVAVIGARAHTGGIAFDLAVRLRTTPEGGPGLHHLISGRDQRKGPEVGRRLFLGVEYSDGRAADNMASSSWPTIGQVESEKPLLVSNSGGGGARSWNQTFWLTPVPPDGPIVFICAWAEFGIPETRSIIADAHLAEASSRAIVLWPEGGEGTQ